MYITVDIYHTEYTKQQHKVVISSPDLTKCKIKGSPSERSKQWAKPEKSKPCENAIAEDENTHAMHSTKAAEDICNGCGRRRFRTQPK